MNRTFSTPKILMKLSETHEDISSSIRFKPACSSDSLGNDP